MTEAPNQRSTVCTQNLRPKHGMYTTKIRYTHFAWIQIDTTTKKRQKDEWKGIATVEHLESGRGSSVFKVPGGTRSPLRLREHGACKSSQDDDQGHVTHPHLFNISRTSEGARLSSSSTSHCPLRSAFTKGPSANTSLPFSSDT